MTSFSCFAEYSSKEKSLLVDEAKHPVLWVWVYKRIYNQSVFWLCVRNWASAGFSFVLPLFVCFKMVIKNASKVTFSCLFISSALQSLSQQPPYLLKHNNVSDTRLLITYHLTWQKSKYLSLEIKIFTPLYPNLFRFLILFPTPMSYPQRVLSAP